MTNNSNAGDEIRIPRALWLAPGLSLREKALLAVIGAADPSLGYRVPNRDIIGFLGVRARHVQSCIAALKAKGFITVRINPDLSRVIKTTAKLAKLSKPRVKRSAR